MIVKKKYTLGIDIGTNGVRVGIFDLKGNAAVFQEEPLAMSFPHPGWAEQEPAAWWHAACAASQAALTKCGIPPEDIIGIGLDATCCTVVAVNEKLEPLRPAIMWMDVRAQRQAERISATGHAALKYNGFGPVSAEFFPCKALWLKENEPETYHKTAWFMECTDYISYLLTGRLALNINTVTMRWYYDSKNGGWNRDFYETIGLGDVFAKLPDSVLNIGERLGNLTKNAAAAMGLLEGTPVAVGISDAHAGVIGLNVVEPGRTALITGTSHLHEGLTETEVHGKGFFGTFPDAVIRGVNLIEGGQTSTGAIVKWFMQNIGKACQGEADERGISLYDLFEEKAARIEIGSEGLMVLDYFQGNRTPYTDGSVRGMLYGLTLKHTPAHIYRAILEGICYGTQHVLETFRKAGYNTTALYASGGATKNKLWVQMHADVSNVPVYIPAEKEAPCLGSAILAAVCAGAYVTIQQAAGEMVRYVEVVAPDADRHAQYRKWYECYCQAYPLTGDWMHMVSGQMQEEG